MRAPLLLVAALLALACAGPASAAPWKQVTAPDGASNEQVDLLRSSDGVLHVAWQHRTGPNTDDLLHTTLSATGSVGATVPIQSGWAEIQNPALVPAPSGLRVFFGGLRTTDPNDPNDDLNTALSQDGGATWSLQPGSVVAEGTQAYGSPVDATSLPDGTPIQTWAGTLGTWVHSGLSPASPNHDYALGNYGYDPGIATDSSGRTVLAWYSSAAGRMGVFAQDVAPDGSPVGSAVNMPGTSDMASGMIGRTPIVARSGGGVYVAYPTGFPATNRIRLWRVGSSTAVPIARIGQGAANATVAAAADGRIWVAWTTSSNGKPRLLARRSNRAVTKFGATVSAGRPRGAAAAYHADASAAGATLDVLAAFSIGTTAATATYHRRLSPGLTLRATPSTIRRGAKRTVTFTVLDAGDPVQGSTVRAAGSSARTRADGTARLDVVGRGRALRARATAAGYSPGRVKLKVR